MKFYILICIFLISIEATAQGKLVVIYADPSENTTNYSLNNKLYDAIQETDSRLILFISNGANPLVSTSIYDMQSIIDRLSKVKPIEPNYNYDLDSLNRLLNKETSLDGIGIRNKNISDDFHFFFFFDAEKCRKLNQVEKVAEALLLSNRLINKDGLVPSCRIRIYLNNALSETDTLYIRKIREEKMYDVVTY